MLESPILAAMRSPLQCAMDRIGSAVWTPARLFAASEQGVWYDPGDFSTLFQDSAGTVPVTTTGQVVGRVEAPSDFPYHATQATSTKLPRYAGAPRTLGSELATNGRFSSDTVWTKGTGWTIASGKAAKAAGTASDLSESIVLESGSYYLIFYSVLRTAGTVRLSLSGGTAVQGVSRSSAGSYTDMLLAETGNNTLTFAADAAFAGSVYSVSVKKVTQFVNKGLLFDGANDSLASGAIDLSASDKLTIVISSQYGQETATRTLIEIGNYYSNTPGSAALTYNSTPNLQARGSSAQVSVSAPAAEGASTGVPLWHLTTASFDLSQSTTLTELSLRARGFVPSLSGSGVEAGSGNAVNGTVTLGSAKNDLFHWSGLIHRAIVINRLLTPDEIAAAERWVMAGMTFCAVLGDSTSAVTNASVGLTNAFNTASFVGGLVHGAADISLAGDNIASQKSKWTAMSGKSALKAVIVQIGLNDVKSRVGGGTATAAQVIADLQDLIDTVNSQKPSGCKVYVSALTPCKVWLDTATNPAAAYSGWLAVNEAISGAGSTPIIGVDGRITDHVALLNDGSGNLNAIYDQNADGVHESNEARFLIAQAWRAKLESDGLVST